MKQKKKKKKADRRGLLILAAVAALLAALFAGMALNAGVLHVMRASVKVKDLPPAFDGKTILYVTDVDLCGLNTPARAADAIMRMQPLKPDLLILGGDYTSRSLGEILEARTDAAAMCRNREEFFRALADFKAPLGKYALTTPEDRELGDLSPILTAAGFTPLNDARIPIDVGGSRLWLVGVNASESPFARYGGAFRKRDCVICIGDNPECFPRITTAEAADSGRWADLCLAGGTHGGQIEIAGRSALSLSAIQQSYLHGWRTDTGAPMLTSSGLGCEALNLRLGSQAEVWVIEVRCFT